MKKYLMGGIAALTLCAGFTSCSHDDIEPMTQAEIDKAKYDFAFLNYVGGKIAADQDWGFGTTTRGLTRAANTWENKHACSWGNKLTFSVPTDTIDITDTKYSDKEGNNTGAVYYVPEKFSGQLNLKDRVKLKGGMSIYNYGTITSVDGDWEGVVTIYNIGTWTWNVTSGQHHTIINTGTFTLANDANIGELYNGGHLEITDTDISNSVSIYSNGEATINMPNGGDFKAAADIHGTLTSAKNAKIQNSNTQYICGIKVNGLLDLTQGKLESSYVEATDITFDGDELWLLPGGHVKANTISIPNGGCYIHGEVNSTGLIEVGNISFKNDNDFERTFSDNIFFKITGSINFEGATNGNVKDKRLYTDAADYVNVNGNLNEHLNAGNATGSPACGQPWSIGDEENDQYDLRIIAEDLSAEGDTDFDFNDIVFDVKFGDNATIKLLAAGGTLPLRINENDDWEVHTLFGVDQDYMVNTNAAGKGLKGSAGTAQEKPVVFQLGKAIYSAADAKDIKIEVFKNGAWQELTAEKGEPAAKIAVGVDYEWLEERTSIKGEYEKFVDWVDGTEFSSEWWK